MRKSEERQRILDDMLTDAVGKGVMHLTAQDATLSGEAITLHGDSLVNFGSCSYLGLEMDARLKQGVVDAVARYGTQFSSSRAYVSAPPYEELEALLGQMFGGHVLAAPSTTLGHMAALPSLIHDEDAVIMDQQVHHSVQTAVNLLRTQGCHVEIIRHNRMDVLEERIVHLRRSYRHVWYLADGVYSMFGAVAPMAKLRALLECYEQLHLYIDDSHGVGWAGLHGRGHALGEGALRPRMVLAASLNKSFAAAGGALVFPDAESLRRVRTCGGPFIFSGPIQPPMLGAALASARIHLSQELAERQAALRERIALFNELTAAHGLPLVAPSESPIRYLGIGLPRVAYTMVARLMADGFYTNVAMFPAVPMRQAGIRIPLTLHHTEAHIHGLLESVARHLPDELHAEGGSVEQVRRIFGLDTPVAADVPTFDSGKLELTTRVARSPAGHDGLYLQHETSIAAIEAVEWDQMLGANGTYSWEGLRFLEATFQGNARPEDNWGFHYFVVRDRAGQPVLATFFTDAIWKDDMLASEAVSEEVERERRKSPYFLTSRTLAMGAQLTEGNHLYLDRQADWQGALRLMLDGLADLQERAGAQSLLLRDLPTDDAEMDEFLLGRGFAKAPMPEAMVMTLDFEGDDDLLAGLSRRTRRHQRKTAFAMEALYDVEVLRHGGRVPTDVEMAHLYHLYLNVKNRSLELNSFAMPRQIFKNMLASPSWELLLLRLKPEHGASGGGLPVAFVACFVGTGHYVPLIVGVNYDYVVSHGAYRQCILQVVRQAKRHGVREVYFGMGATLEKQRFGAVPRRQNAYFQSTDLFNLDLLAEMQTRLTKPRT